MIKIQIFRDNSGYILEFVVKGHAGFKESGKDIVCSAVSTVAYNAINALSILVDINNYIEKDGYIKCKIPNNLNEEKKYTAKIILETIAIGFKQIEDSYRKYVKVIEKEVDLNDKNDKN